MSWDFIVESRILFVIFGSLLGTIFSMRVWYTLDDDFKNKHHLEDVFNLRKTKYLFVYSNRKKGEISKPILWLNLANYIYCLLVLNGIIFFSIFQTESLRLFMIWSSLLGIFIIVVPLVILCNYYAHKAKKQKEWQDYQRSLELEKERQEFIKKRAEQEQAKQKHVEQPEPIISQEKSHDKM